MKKITKISKIFLVFMMIFSQLSSVVRVLAEEILTKPLTVTLENVLDEDGNLDKYNFTYISTNNDYDSNKDYNIDLETSFKYSNGDIDEKSYETISVSGNTLNNTRSYYELEPISKYYNGLFEIKIKVSDKEERTTEYETTFTYQVNNYKTGLTGYLKNGLTDVMPDSESGIYNIEAGGEYTANLQVSVGELSPKARYRVTFGEETTDNVTSEELRTKVFEGNKIDLTDKLYGEYNYTDTITLEEIDENENVLHSYNYEYKEIINYIGNNDDMFDTIYEGNNLDFEGEYVFVDAINLNDSVSIPDINDLIEAITDREDLEIKIFDENGNDVTDGEIQNGYVIEFTDGISVSYKVVIRGDNTSDNTFNSDDMLPTMNNYLNSETNLAMDFYTNDNEELGTITFEDIMYINELLKGSEGNVFKEETDNESLNVYFSELPEQVFVGDTLELSLLVNNTDIDEYIDGLNGVISTNELLKITDISFNNGLIGTYNSDGKFVAAGSKISDNDSVVMTITLMAVAEGMGTVTVEGDTAKYLNIKEFDSLTNNIQIIREVSSNSYLASLKASVGSFDVEFDKDVTEYTLTVPYDTKTVILSGALDDAFSEVSGLIEYELVNDKTVATITVTAEDGSTRVYTVYIVKEAKPVTSTADTVAYYYSSNNYLRLLEIDGYEIEFDRDTNEYKIKVGNDVNSLDIRAIAEDAGARVEITGNENFKVGKNIVVVKVIAENGDTREYTITVEKEADSSKTGIKEIEDSSNTAEKVVIIILIILVVLGLLYLIFKKDDEDDNKSLENGLKKTNNNKQSSNKKKK